ncbi:MAG: ABC transporter ATP-binding protein [Clostridia bacterium]|nr:ABC transporter ATP-binding protein [Clostridia bacterium]
MLKINRKTENSDVRYRGNAFLRLMGYLKPYWKTIVICLVLVLALTALELYKPILIGDAIDRYITGDFEPGEMAQERFLGVLKAAGLYILVLAGIFLCSRTQYLMIQELGQKIIYGMRNQLLEHVQKLTMRFFDVTPVGRIVTRITNDTEAINDLYANTLVRMFRNVVMVIALAVVMLSIDVKMALLSFVLVPVVMALTILFRKLSRQAYQLTKTRLTTLNTFLSEHISGMKLIQIFAREPEKRTEFNGKSGELYQAGYKEMMVYAIFRPSIYFMSVAALAIILAGGSLQVLEGVISIGTLYVFTQYISSLYNPIQELAEQFSTLQAAIASAEKIFTLLDEEPLITDPDEPEKLPEVRGRIEFDHVWFAYEEDNYVLRDVSFVIEPGQKVAFVGATGAGKSSILNLIGRYYDVQKGSIRIDGVDIRNLSREQIRRAIGQVQQDVFIFTGDVKSNIRLRDEDITDAQVQEAARYTNTSRFIERLPGGYDERVTERGATFSQGQRQLLSFARTLAYDPKILILDEATANIDTETELWIQEALERLMQGRTTIMVAHRLSTIQHADRIIVMHHGKIRESGTHQELLEMDGIYKKLYKLQLS